MITLNFVPSPGTLEMLMRFIFSTTGKHFFLFMGGWGKLSLQHQGQKPHFTEKVTYSRRIKETLWKPLGSFLQNVDFGGSH